MFLIQVHAHCVLHYYNIIIYYYKQIHTDLWKLVQLLRTVQSPPLLAAVSTYSSQSQTLHSLSHHNLGGTHRERQTVRKKIKLSLTSFFNNIWLYSSFIPRQKCLASNILPRALNICMPPYFPSKSTVLLRGLNALHIRTKTTSKQPGERE